MSINAQDRTNSDYPNQNFEITSRFLAWFGTKNTAVGFVLAVCVSINWLTVINTSF